MCLRGHRGDRCWSPSPVTLGRIGNQFSLKGVLAVHLLPIASAPPAANRWQESFGERSPEGHAGPPHYSRKKPRSGFHSA